MKAKNLQKATVLLQEIHELDKQLIALDKKAITIADGKEFTKVTIAFEEPKKEEAKIDMDGYSGLESLYKMYSPFGLYSEKKEAKNDSNTHSLNMTPTECLFVIGALIQAKKEYRRTLCNKIIELGVSL